MPKHCKISKQTNNKGRIGGEVNVSTRQRSIVIKVVTPSSVDRGWYATTFGGGKRGIDGIHEAKATAFFFSCPGPGMSNPTPTIPVFFYCRLRRLVPRHSLHQ
jgi:hypothetical protein